MIPEGGMAFICVNVTGGLQQRETVITLTHSVTIGNGFTSMFDSLVHIPWSHNDNNIIMSNLLICLIVGENVDFLIDSNTPLVITPEVSQACLQFRAIDDLIAENPEEVTLTFEMSGQIVGSTTAVITDNDGMCVCVGGGGGDH